MLFVIGTGVFMLAATAAALRYLPRLILTFSIIGAALTVPLYLVLHASIHASSQTAAILQKTVVSLWPTALLLMVLEHPKSMSAALIVIVSVFANAVIYGLVGALVSAVAHSSRR